jgi:nitric oxide reductase large subunit
MTTKKLWIGFVTVMVLSFSVLLYFGNEIYKQAPPIPEKVVKPDGTVLFTGQNIKDGQNVWQSLGGQEIGTVWGHGAYQAPDWSADWLHKEAEWKETWIKFAFWSINIGLAAMVLISVLPIGLAQTVVSVKTGLWYARSAEFMQLPAMHTLKWLRVIGDTIFASGTLALAWFIFGLKGGWSIVKK